MNVSAHRHGRIHRLNIRLGSQYILGLIRKQDKKTIRQQDNNTSGKPFSFSSSQHGLQTDAVLRYRAPKVLSFQFTPFSFTKVVTQGSSIRFLSIRMERNQQSAVCNVNSVVTAEGLLGYFFVEMDFCCIVPFRTRLELHFPSMYLLGAVFQYVDRVYLDRETCCGLHPFFVGCCGCCCRSTVVCIAVSRKKRVSGAMRCSPSCCSERFQYSI